MSLQPTYGKFYLEILGNKLENIEKLEFPKSYEHYQKMSFLQFSLCHETSDEMKDYFLKHEKNVNYQNSMGETAVYLCCKNSNETCLKKLLEMGANPDIQDELGSTALHVACSSENENMIKLLLEYHANRFLVNDKGYIPIELTSKYKNLLQNKNENTIAPVPYYEKPEGFWRKISNFFSQPVEETSKEKIILEYIRSNKIKLEKHETKTKDGYSLEMMRLSNEGKAVVFLQHGVMNSGATWCVCGEKGLAFYLYRLGYDVWLGNNRGTQFSRKHEYLSDKETKFWDFTFSDLGKFDFPAQIYYALAQSKAVDLTYIGHSQGTTQAFLGLTLDEELQKKINLFVALAPVVTLEYQTSSAFRYLAKMKAEKIIDLYPLGELGHRSVTTSILPKLSDYLGFSDQLWNLFMDTDLDLECLPLLSQTEPSPTSAKNMVHWTQLIRSGKFHDFDFGKEMNLRIYGYEYPPLFDISKIETPIMLFYGEFDKLATPTDVEKNVIPNIKKLVHSENIKNFKHNDFVRGKNAVAEIYEKIQKVMLENLKKAEQLESLETVELHIQEDVTKM
eukprot:gene6626-10792_t